MPTQVGDYPEILSYKVTSPTPVMTIPDDPSNCDTDEVPTFRYAASSGLVGKGRLCEWKFRRWFFAAWGRERVLETGGLTGSTANVFTPNVYCPDPKQHHCDWYRVSDTPTDGWVGLGLGLGDA